MWSLEAGGSDWGMLSWHGPAVSPNSTRQGTVSDGASADPSRPVGA